MLRRSECEGNVPGERGIDLCAIEYVGEHQIQQADHY